MLLRSGRAEIGSVRTGAWFETEPWEESKNCWSSKRARASFVVRARSHLFGVEVEAEAVGEGKRLGSSWEGESGGQAFFFFLSWDCEKERERERERRRSAWDDNHGNETKKKCFNLQGLWAASVLKEMNWKRSLVDTSKTWGLCFKIYWQISFTVFRDF